MYHFHPWIDWISFKDMPKLLLKHCDIFNLNISSSPHLVLRPRTSPPRWLVPTLAHPLPHLTSYLPTACSHLTTGRMSLLPPRIVPVSHQATTARLCPPTPSSPWPRRVDRIYLYHQILIFVESNIIVLINCQCIYSRQYLMFCVGYGASACAGVINYSLVTLQEHILHPWYNE